MLKNLRYGWESLRLAYQANGIGALLLLFSAVYENTLFPFIQIVLLARFLDLLGRSQHVAVTAVVWLIGFYVVGSICNVLLMSYRDAKESYQQIKTDSYLDILINTKL